MDGETMQWMGKHKGNGIDGEIGRKWNGWENTKAMETMGNHKGNGNDGETQRKSNGWRNAKGIGWMGNTGNGMNRET